MSDLFQRSHAIEGVALDEQEILFHPATNKFVLLNPAACFLWGQLATARSTAQIADAMCARFHGVTRAQAEADAGRLLEQFAARQLLGQPVTQPESAPAAQSPGTVLPGTGPYHVPMLRDVTEDEVLTSFQMTAAEISAASCWWISCATGCP